LVDRKKAVEKGFLGLAGWLEKAEAIWTSKKKQAQQAAGATVYQWLDYRRKLTTQRPAGVWNVLQGRVGTHLACSVLRSGSDLQAEGLRAQGFVSEADIFFHQTESEAEAHYLCAVLNAPLVDNRIKKYQTQGLWGARHIQRRAFEVLPVPRFDPKDPRHVELAELSRACHDKVASLVPSLRGQSVGRLRSQVRTHLSAELARIDGLVEKILP